MLEAVKPELLWISADSQDRLPVIEAAIQHGARGIAVEPPLCGSLSELDEMARLCREQDVRLTAFHTTRYDPRLPAVRELLASGGLGRILEIRACGAFDRRGSDRSSWAPAEELLSLIGEIGGKPRRCLGRAYTAGRTVSEQNGAPPADGEPHVDAFHATYWMSGGMTAHLELVRKPANGSIRPGWKICGSRGVLEMIPGYPPTIRLLPQPAWSRPSGRKPATLFAADCLLEIDHDRRPWVAHLTAMQDLILSIEEDREPLGLIAAARAAMEMLVAAVESQRRGHLVKFPCLPPSAPLPL
jgi:predicted dehydrogenase